MDSIDESATPIEPGLTFAEILEQQRKEDERVKRDAQVIELLTDIRNLLTPKDGNIKEWATSFLIW